MLKKETQDKMIEMLDYIKEFTASNGYPPSVREICKAMRIKSTATVYYYLNLLEDNNYIKKAQSKNRAIEVVNKYKDSFPKKNLIDIPLVGRIAAGEPILATENLEDVYSVSADKFSSTNDLFMLKVCGESMINAGINDSDIIVVNKQPSADNGQIVVAMVDGNATVKRFYIKNDHYILRPENDNMNDIIVQDVDILGVVVGLIRQY